MPAAVVYGSGFLVCIVTFTSLSNLVLPFSSGLPLSAVMTYLSLEILFGAYSDIIIDFNNKYNINDAMAWQNQFNFCQVLNSTLYKKK